MMDFKKAKMELVSWNAPGPYVSIKYAVQWKSDDGSIRIPQPSEESVFEGSHFSAAGKSYTSWKQLCAEQTVEPYAFTDKYGRQVFAYKELFLNVDDITLVNLSLLGKGSKGKHQCNEKHYFL